jgi:23S rRNA (cytosine1962-C5)-methyltransferase
MKPPALRLKRGHEAARTHPWIFKGDVADVSDVDAGSAIAVVDAGGRFVGRGFYNARPALCCRILTWTDEPLDAAFFRRRLEAAVSLRGRGHAQGPPTLCRLVWSEADELPGLVIDRYGPVLVTQCLTLGMARARSVVTAALSTMFPDTSVFDMDDPHAAQLEGFSAALGWAGGSGPRTVRVVEGGVTFEVTIGIGHKTGLYLDQRENRAKVGALARDRDVLDAFSYTAGFACHALRGGARRAVCIESSPEANFGARQNLELNGFTPQAEIRASNVFDELRRLERDGARFGVVVLDPPPFARSRSALDAAARGYKEINLRALRLLERGGSLFTFSCSHHVSDSMFEEICRDASADAGVRVRIIDRLAQAHDHPVLLSIPETRYLKGLQLEVV